MTLVVVATIGAVLGAVGLGWGCRTVRPSRRARLSVRALPEGAPAGGRDVATDGPAWADGMACALSEWTSLRSTVEPWLRMVAVSWPAFVEQLARTAAAGAASGCILALVLHQLGDADADLAVLMVPVSTAVGALAPVVGLRRAAADRRRQARSAVAAYLDLVVMSLAGGMGVESALEAAATVADDTFSARIAGALAVAGAAGRPPWEALADLADQFDLGELHELAATMSLAGTEGARVRSSLSAKADSLRRRQLTEAESEANAVTERLFVPGVLLLLGFLVFIGYPAVSRIVAGL